MGSARSDVALLDDPGLLAAAYGSSRSIAELAVEVGVSGSTVRRALVRHGVARLLARRTQRRHQRTANKITSGGNRNPANETEALQRQPIVRARYDPHLIRQRNSALNVRTPDSDSGSSKRHAQCSSNSGFRVTPPRTPIDTMVPP
jgi:hypothetical protein